MVATQSLLLASIACWARATNTHHLVIQGCYDSATYGANSEFWTDLKENVRNGLGSLSSESRAAGRQVRTAYSWKSGFWYLLRYDRFNFLS